MNLKRVLACPIRRVGSLSRHLTDSDILRKRIQSLRLFVITVGTALQDIRVGLALTV